MSLARACKCYIEEGDCTGNSENLEEDNNVYPQYPTSPQLKKEVRESRKITRTGKKRQDHSHHVKLEDYMIDRGKPALSNKTMRQEGERVSESS